MPKQVLLLVFFASLAFAHFDAPFIIQANVVNLAADISGRIVNASHTDERVTTKLTLL